MCQDVITQGIQWPTKDEAMFWNRAPRTVPMTLPDGDTSVPPVERDAQALHVVHVTAEMAPIAKV